jgi:apolipoprotein N-acyltransferase
VAFIPPGKIQLAPEPLLLACLGATGIFFGLPNSLLHLPPLSLLFPFSLYMLAMAAPGGKQAFKRGWWLGFCGNAAGLYWLVFPLHDVAGIPLVLAIPFVVLLFIYLSLFTALASLGLYNLRGFAAAVCRGRACFSLPVLLGGLAYGGFEVFCSWLFTGFPWLTLSTAFAFQPAWTQAASLVGAYGLSAFYAVAAFAAAAACLESGKPRLTAAAVALGILLALPGYGMFRLAPTPEREEQPLSLIMVQGNIDQSLKWERAFQKATLDHYLALSKEALSACASSPSCPKPELLLWPETAMPFYFQQHNEYADTIRRFATDNGVYLAFGAPAVSRDSHSTSLLNRLYMLSPSGSTAGFYDKEHLVPFGEYTPFATSIPFLSDVLQGMGFIPGMHNESLRLRRQGNPDLLLGALICYEAIFPALAQERVEQGAEILINVSNDGWFRKSSAPLQHLAHAVLRCVEQSRSLARATNTGITAVIDPYGRITAYLDTLFVDGTLTTTVAPCRKTTLYHRLRPVPEVLLMALALFSLFSYRYAFRKPKNRNTNASTA